MDYQLRTLSRCHNPDNSRPEHSPVLSGGRSRQLLADFPCRRPSLHSLILLAVVLGLVLVLVKIVQRWHSLGLPVVKSRQLRLIPGPGLGQLDLSIGELGASRVALQDNFGRLRLDADQLVLVSLDLVL